MKVFISGAAGDARLPRWRDDFLTTLTTFIFLPVQIDNCAAGGNTTIHVPNTGPMTGLLDVLPAQVALSVAPAGTKRKYAHTLEWLQLPREVRGVLVGGVVSGQVLGRQTFGGDSAAPLPSFPRLTSPQSKTPLSLKNTHRMSGWACTAPRPTPWPGRCWRPGC